MAPVEEEEEAQAVELISQAISEPTRFHFGSLLHNGATDMDQHATTSFSDGGLASVIRSEEGTCWLQTLALFAHGTWPDYVRAQGTNKYITLDKNQEMKLKCLTLVSMCENTKYLEYQEVMNVLDMHSVQELESFVVHQCIYTGLVEGRLDQQMGRIHVLSAIPRDVSPEKFEGMIQSLDVWLEQAGKVAYFLEEQANNIDSAQEKRDSVQSYRKEKVQEAREKVLASVAESKKLAPKQGALGERDVDESRLSKRRK